MPHMIGKYSEEFLRKRAAQIATNKTKNSNILSGDQESLTPKFDPSEIRFGNELGQGGFCTVYEVKKVQLKKDFLSSTQAGDIDSDSGDEDYFTPNAVKTQDRRFIAAKYIRSGKDARYAVKTMIKNVQDPTRFLGGVIDLAIETRFLAVIHHPNIIKMRAMSSADPYQDNFFIVLDRLYDTLADRLVAWKASKKKTIGFHRVRDFKGDKKRQIWVDRVLVAHDICSALKYLHENRILYRDLKPDNIGFDVRGDVKIFDFGLAKELTHEDQMDDEVYALSGKTGSLRYMAPEVAKEEPYNTSADVYSFAILLWQICALATPFKGCTVKTHYDLVVVGGVRPEIGPSWSVKLSTLLTRGWSEDILERPKCTQIMDILRSEVNPFLGKSENYALDASNRTAASIEAQVK